jgi:hypothetical protein
LEEDHVLETGFVMEARQRFHKRQCRDFFPIEDVDSRPVLGPKDNIFHKKAQKLVYGELGHVQPLTDGASCIVQGDPQSRGLRAKNIFF